MGLFIPPSRERTILFQQFNCLYMVKPEKRKAERKRIVLALLQTPQPYSMRLYDLVRDKARIGTPKYNEMHSAWRRKQRAETRKKRLMKNIVRLQKEMYQEFPELRP